MQKSNGMNYAPRGKSAPVCAKGDFRVGVIGLDHGHIFGMCNGLVEAGAELVGVYDPDPAKVENFRKAFSDAKAVSSKKAILEDPSIHLVASAAVPCDRCDIGLEAMDHGKDYFTDKPPFTTLDQIAAARKKGDQTGKKYAVYYSERLHVEAAVFTGTLIADGAIGRVVQVIGMGPHRISLSQRPRWFFEKEKFGGILVDLGCHQIEQFLFYSGAKDARVLSSKVANYKFKQYPGLEDFGDELFPGRLVHAGRPGGLGRREGIHPRHRRIYRNEKVHRRGPQQGRRPGVSRRPQRRTALLRDRAGRLPFLWRPYPGQPEPHDEGLFPGDVFQGRGTGRHCGADRDTNRMISMGRSDRHEEIIRLVSKLREVSVRTLPNDSVSPRDNFGDAHDFMRFSTPPLSILVPGRRFPDTLRH
jgi:hypothetical protein